MRCCAASRRWRHLRHGTLCDAPGARDDPAASHSLHDLCAGGVLAGPCCTCAYAGAQAQPPSPGDMTTLSWIADSSTASSMSAAPVQCCGRSLAQSSKPRRASKRRALKPASRDCEGHTRASVRLARHAPHALAKQVMQSTLGTRARFQASERWEPIRCQLQQLTQDRLVPLQARQICAFQASSGGC